MGVNRMIAERTHDIKLISSVALHPDMVNDMLEDGQSIADCSFNTDNDCYLSVKDREEVIAVYILKPLSKTVIDIHPMVIPAKRRYGNESIKSVFDWILSNCSKSVNKVVAQFPSTRKNIERFAMCNGFTKEGINRLSFMKNNELIDQTMVGITREEITELLR